MEKNLHIGWSNRTFIDEISWILMSSSKVAFNSNTYVVCGIKPIALYVVLVVFTITTMSGKSTGKYMMQKCSTVRSASSDKVHMSSTDDIPGMASSDSICLCVSEREFEDNIFTYMLLLITYTQIDVRVVRLQYQLHLTLDIDTSVNLAVKQKI